MLFACSLAALAQTNLSVKEYIRFGGRVVAMESRAGASQLPDVWVDEPAANSVVGGIINLRGWALNNTAANNSSAVTSIALSLDGSTTPLVQAYPSSQYRPDVCNTWPGRAGCPQVGYIASWNTATVADGPHTLRAVATDDHGRASTPYTVAFTVANHTLASSTDIAPRLIDVGVNSGMVGISIFGVQNAASVSVAAWCFSYGGQDDLVWYPAQNLGAGTWVATVNLGNHTTGVNSPSPCQIVVDGWGANAAGNGFLGEAYLQRDLTVWPAPNPSVAPTAGGTGPAFFVETSNTGSLDLYITNVRDADAVWFPVWSAVNGTDDLYNYLATNLGRGTWKVSVDLSRHPGLGPIYYHAFFQKNGQWIFFDGKGWTRQ